MEVLYTTLPFGKFRNGADEAFATVISIRGFVKKYYDAEVLKAQMDKEAEIAAYVALKQYLEDKKS